jgi:hypothetical protein
MATIQYKTPGVYISEPDSFPPAIVGVETAVPAFIGYTEFATERGKDLNLTPTRISSFAEYIAKFGGPYQERYYLREVPPAPADGHPAPSPDTLVATVSLHDGGAKYQLMEDGAASFLLYSSVALFYANGGGDCYIVSCGTFDGPDGKVTKASLELGLAAIARVVGPTMIVVPDAVLLDAAGDDALSSPDFNEVAVAMLRQCADLRDRVALLDVWGTHTLPENADTAAITTLVGKFRTGLAGAPPETLRYGMAYFPFLRTSTVSKDQISLDSFLVGEPHLAALTGALKGAVDYYYPASGTTPDPRNAAVAAYVDAVGPAVLASTTPEGRAAARTLTQNLGANLPSLGNLFSLIAESQSRLPPSGAMAGIFTTNDTSRGVWNAPANVGIASLVAPTVAVGDRQQDDLNSPTQGKAINAIRTFPTRGPLVWGARTLDSTSNDWRYIQVRRTMIYIEQSVKTALNAFVFAPNTASTWTTVASMIESFLHGVWAAGGLMGSSPAQAYGVRCGLGSTMTPDDVLNGNMIVQVVVQMVHPAEFIELVFKQQMLGSA